MESKRHLESNYIQFGVRRQDNVLLKHHSLFSIYATLKKKRERANFTFPLITTRTNDHTAGCFPTSLCTT